MYGVNSSIINPNTNNNKPSTIPLILIATADEEHSKRNNNLENHEEKNTNSYIGVNVRGLYTSLQHDRYPSAPIPHLEDYYNKSFKLISEGGTESYSLCILLGSI